MYTACTSRVALAQGGWLDPTLLPVIGAQNGGITNQATKLTVVRSPAPRVFESGIRPSLTVLLARPSLMGIERHIHPTLQQEVIMSVARVTEIIAASPKSFDDAIHIGIARANKTLQNVKSAWIEDQKVDIEDGKNHAIPCGAQSDVRPQRLREHYEECGNDGRGDAIDHQGRSLEGIRSVRLGENYYHRFDGRQYHHSNPGGKNRTECLPEEMTGRRGRRSAGESQGVW